jgi:hypothetical protein
MTLGVLFLISGASALVGYVYAEERGRNERTWVLLGLLFGLFAVAALFLMPRLPDQPGADDERLPLFGNGR